MACKKCSQNIQIAQKEVLLPQDCVYSLEELINKLNEVSQDPDADFRHTFYLRSAIGWYSKNCNKFNKYLAPIFL